jgi:hypothetical protein
MLRNVFIDCVRICIVWLFEMNTQIFDSDIV